MAAADVAQTAADDEAAYPSRLYAWFVVGLLTCTYCVSLLDRWIMSLLVAPIKAHFLLSDTQMGLLMGPVFAMTYIIMGLPFGWVADRKNRKNLIAAAVAFWSLATIACGLARNTPQLAMARFGIGIGEAALSPAANSLIADHFPRAMQSRAIGIYGMGIYGGQGIAYLLGAVILAWATTLVAAPAWSQFEPFQVVFFIVGAPGLILALLLLFLVREPPRRQRLAATDSEASTLKCLAYVGVHWRGFVPLAVGMGAAPLVGYMKLWLPTLFYRTWGWEVRDFAILYGTLLLVVGPLGAVCSGYLSTWLYKQGRKEGPYICTIAAVCALVVCGAVMPLAPTPAVALMLLAPAAFAGSMATASGIASMVFASPAEFRGRMLAMYTIVNGTIGVFVGPAGVGWLNDNVFTDGDGIRLSMSTLVAAFGGTLALILLLGRRPYGRAVIALEARQAAASTGAR